MSWRPGDPVRIVTERFLLRSLTPADATPRYLAWLMDERVMRYVNARFDAVTIDKIRAHIAEGDDRSVFRLGIFTGGEERHVGNFAVTCHPHHLHCHQGVLIGDLAFWGKEVVTETRAALLDFLFGPVGMEKVCGACYADNVPALFNYRAQGFSVEGTLRSHVISGGRRTDVVNFAMFRADWLERRGS